MRLSRAVCRQPCGHECDSTLTADAGAPPYIGQARRLHTSMYIRTNKKIIWKKKSLGKKKKFAFRTKVVGNLLIRPDLDSDYNFVLLGKYVFSSDDSVV